MAKYERPSYLTSTEIDPDAPGLLGLLRGERGEVWRAFTVGACAVLAAVNAWGAVHFLL